MKKRVAVMFITALGLLAILLHINPTTADAFSAADFQKKDLSPFNKKVVAIIEQSKRAKIAFTPAPRLNKEVVGYYTQDWAGDTGSQQSVDAYAGKMAGVATFSYQLKSDGTFIGKAPATAVAKVRKNGGKAVVLVHNCANGGFDQNLIHKVLTSAQLREKAVKNIITVMKSGSFDGVNIDFENIASGDRAVFTKFMSELSKTLHDNGYMVTISVPAKTSDVTTGWGGAFDYKALAPLVDRMMLMTYDEHWFGGTPGPVASLGWVENVIIYAKSQVPVDKLLLGLGMYGYDWEVASGKGVRAMSATKALQTAAQNGAAIKWDDKAQVPYYYYKVNGVQRVVWFESNDSASHKLDLVNKYNLSGIAIWKLGFEDGDFWKMIEKKFKTSQ